MHGNEELCEARSTKINHLQDVPTMQGEFSIQGFTGDMERTCCESRCGHYESRLMKGGEREWMINKVKLIHGEPNRTL